MILILISCQFKRRFLTFNWKDTCHRGDAVYVRWNRVPAEVDFTIHQSLQPLPNFCHCCCRNTESNFPSATQKGLPKPDALKWHWRSFLSLTPVTSTGLSMDKFYRSCRTGKSSLKMVSLALVSPSMWSKCFCDWSKWLGSRNSRGSLAFIAVIAQPTGHIMQHGR